MNTISFEQVEKKDYYLTGYTGNSGSDVAELYKVKNKRINEAVSNNPDKFPTGYIIRLEKQNGAD